MELHAKALPNPLYSLTKLQIDRRMSGETLWDSKASLSFRLRGRLLKYALNFYCSIFLGYNQLHLFLSVGMYTWIGLLP